MLTFGWILWAIWIAYCFWNIRLLSVAGSWVRKSTKCHKHSIELMDSYVSGGRIGSWEEVEEIVEANSRIADIYYQKGKYYQRSAYMPWRFRGRAK